MIKTKLLKHLFEAGDPLDDLAAPPDGPGAPVPEEEEESGIEGGDEENPFPDMGGEDSLEGEDPSDIKGIIDDKELQLIDKIEKFSGEISKISDDPDLIFKGVQSILQNNAVSDEQLKAVIDKLNLTRNTTLQSVASRLGMYLGSNNMTKESKDVLLRKFIAETIRQELNSILNENPTAAPPKLDVQAAMQLDVDSSQAILDFSKLIRKHLRLPEVNDMDDQAQEIYVRVINELKSDLKRSVLTAIKKLSSIPKIQDEEKRDTTDVFPARV